MMFSTQDLYQEALKELVRCVALSRICYGDRHWKLAEAHVNLAQGYVQLKGLSLQAKQHAEKAREILLTNSLLPSSEENIDIFKCSIDLFHTLGRALTKLQKLKEASQSLTKADRLSQELLNHGKLVKEEWIEIQAKIKLSFAQLYQIQMKSEEALLCYEESLRYTKSSKGRKSPDCIPVLKEMAAVEQILGNYDSAIDHLIQAYHIIQKQDFSVEEKIDSALSVAHAAVASSRAEHNDVAEQYFQMSMTILKEARGITNDKFFAIQDEFCHFLRSTGNQKRATQILKESLGAKVATFGNISPEVAGTYCLLGEADLAQGDQNMAYRKFKKCLQIQTSLYGSQDKRTTATQQTLDSLTKITEVTAKQKPTNKARPPFCAVIPQRSMLGRTKTNICH
ncbi:tetratricopeptide repeat protein 23 isoform X2 [Monodelphis domestica]|uniref:tetratricopeptide repeat protein 23 isoform X2 n=1 Tax=Monodelphis domestica TaxID=13616 RepID=UPI00044353D3|nr:tetratricopeptide repeat protein 23 isoform X2 [Monodelphis domestica]XP_056663068.1 tetratricopeptide repeat protein 23 isoform X2 [Monodelphis domestica]XP_056663071.1 tetratricopeptide repeat protein 23 isoform X2 [Monodelphis domestica]